MTATNEDIFIQRETTDLHYIMGLATHISMDDDRVRSSLNLLSFYKI
jgi:hypothetical protein